MTERSIKRSIIHINEELCNGCGVCISPCAEGALELVDGKAKVIREELCDGAGFCLGVCPVGALTLEVRNADQFSEQAVEAMKIKIAGRYIPQVCNFCQTTEDDAYMLPIKHKGEALWVCTRCLPKLIHQK
jgi:MinD superfamily P-loop ATPase